MAKELTVAAEIERLTAIYQELPETVRAGAGTDR